MCNKGDVHHNHTALKSVTQMMQVPFQHRAESGGLCGGLAKHALLPSRPRCVVPFIQTLSLSLLFLPQFYMLARSAAFQMLLFNTHMNAAAHEVAHYRNRFGAELYLPFIVPAGYGFLGSFGGITRLKGFLPDRDALLKFGTSVGCGLLMQKQGAFRDCHAIQARKSALF